ncbi:Mut7-C RNAse domain-containing protein [Ferrimonas futtsuensis]|uniref:Mut7-C RNAse domain-containing protein n=1 Tax=Ferrimonas futtsuensis TaxID=364764 RepID=UPI0006855599|nr:Mut7-C RNAse domain-containing protein [Ferrimonas futtsuensis]
MQPDPHAPLGRHVTLRCYRELNDFLPVASRERRFPFRFRGQPSLKSVLEGAGVPQAEVDLVLMNGQSVALDHPIVGGERLEVFPLLESLELDLFAPLRPRPLPDAFIVDVNLGRLARLLRLSGLDCLYRRDFDDEEIVRLACEQGRGILTRDKGVLHRGAVIHGYWVRHTDPERQLLEVIHHYRLEGRLRFFSRCTRCNGVLHVISRDAARQRVPAGAWREHHHFFVCDGCGQVYWRGSHYEAMNQTLTRLGLLPKKQGPETGP